jgi:prevent-host-death family protein
MYKILSLYIMHTLALSEFRANASAMLDLVEQGETVRIMRHGKPVADLVPVRAQESEEADSIPSWKRPFDPVKLPPGVSLSQAVLDERDEAPW